MPKTALVTGASSGIGLELAKLFAQDKTDLILAARSRAKLEEIARELTVKHGITATVVSCDLSIAGAAQELYDNVTRRGLNVDFLVNNAGFGVHGATREIDLAQELSMLELNDAAVLTLTKLFSRDMIQRGFGRVLNVASTAAFQPGPFMAVYYASKSFVLSYSEALNTEFQGTGVTVTCLCPGPTPTNFQTRAGSRTGGLKKIAQTSAEFVAAKGYQAMHKGKSVEIPGLINKVLVFAVRLLPRRIVASFIRQAVE